MASVPSGGGPLAYVEDLEVPVLSEADHHHLARVRRLRAGDELIVGDGRGGWRSARFAGLEPEPAGEVQVEERMPPAVAVGFALVKGTKPELVVQKLVELGVDAVHPFVAARSVVRWDRPKADAALVRWRRVAVEAGMQSRRAWLATIEPLASFAEVAACPGACLADRAALDVGSGPSLDRPLVLTGPEGGWDADERSCGLPVVALGPGVLRAETAAIVAGSLLAALRAGLVAPPG